MLRQYGAQRRAGGFNPFGAGTMRIGTIVYIQDRGYSYHSPIRRNPWVVVAWLNREYYPAVSGRPPTIYMAGGHLAIVRSLRTGEVKRVADWLLLQSEALDCVKAEAPYERPPTNGRIPPCPTVLQPKRRNRRAA